MRVSRRKTNGVSVSRGETNERNVSKDKQMIGGGVRNAQQRGRTRHSWPRAWCIPRGLSVYVIR